MVALGDPAGRMRPPPQPDPIEVDLDVGMVVRCLGELGHPVDEGQRLCEVVEAELALQRPVDLGPALAHVPKYRAESY